MSSKTMFMTQFTRGGLSSTMLQSRGCRGSGCRPHLGSRAPSSPGSGVRGRRWANAPTMGYCWAVGSVAADMGVGPIGPPSFSHGTPDEAAAVAAPGPVQPPLQVQHQSDVFASYTVSNGHSPFAAVSDEEAVASSSSSAKSIADGAASMVPAEGSLKITSPSADTVPPDKDPGATSVDGMNDTRKFVFADEWGFTRVGGDLPEGTTPATFSDMLPGRLFTFDTARAALAVAIPLAAMAIGYSWLWYWHSICPIWQQLACAVLIGTAYTGLFKVAHDCAAFSFLPQSPRLQDALGLALMLPSLFPYTSWRIHYMHHLVNLNMLWGDEFGWHPYTKLQLATELLCDDPWRLALRRLVLVTPLKLFASVGHWLRSFDSLDLKRFHPDTYWAVIVGWAFPILFLGFGVPAILGTVGMSGFVSGYILPWLVFHFWLSTLTLLRHTAPHIPFRAEDEGYDSGRATICGTVTVRMPRPLEVLLNDANYALPQLVAPGLPCFHAREAYEYMRERLLPYLTEARLSVKLLTNHVTKWQVYDEATETYLPIDEVQRSLEADIDMAMVEAEKAEAQEAVAGARAPAEFAASLESLSGGAAGGLAIGGGPGPAFA